MIFKISQECDVVTDGSSGDNDVAGSHDGGAAGKVLESSDILVELVAILSKVDNVLADGDDLAKAKEVLETTDSEGSGGCKVISDNLSACNMSNLSNSS